MFNKLFFMIFMGLSVVLGMQVAVQAETGLPKAPGWYFGAEIPMFTGRYKYVGVQGGDAFINPPTENQKIITSWGYKARAVDEIKDLVPEPFYNMLKHPEVWGEVRINETEFIPNTGSGYKKYLELTEKYKGTCSLDEKGWLRNYTAGLPFPDVDPEKDPQWAGYKIMWNFLRRFQFDDRKYCCFESLIDRAGNVRDLANNYHILRFNGRLKVDPMPLYEPNPKGIDFVGSLPYTDPYNLRGTIPLFYLYDDPDKLDDMWMYIPAMRRVRRMSTAQRQDRLPGGMDYTWDTNESFQGKLVNFDVTYLGEKEMLAPVVSSIVPQIDSDGYLTGVDQYYQRRKCYIVKLSYKKPITMSDIILWIDAEFFTAPYSLNKDVKGNDWMFQSYFYGRDKDGYMNMSMSMNAIDIQRRHDSRAVCYDMRVNLGQKADAFLMESLKKKYLVR